MWLIRYVSNRCDVFDAKGKINTQGFNTEKTFQDFIMLNKVIEGK